ncbi:MAG: DUF167 domain-containing protein [Rhodospirillales bacterium]|nr:DUF167 domain-containing protein [Rhodospirillales bacterium]
MGPDGVRLELRLTPKARADRIDGLALDADGQWVLRLAVTAPPEDGKANRALIAFLAKSLKLPQSALALVQGAGHRRKRVAIQGSPNELAARLDAWIGGQHG